MDLVDHQTLFSISNQDAVIPVSLKKKVIPPTQPLVPRNATASASLEAMRRDEGDNNLWASLVAPW